MTAVERETRHETASSAYRLNDAILLMADLRVAEPQDKVTIGSPQIMVLLPLVRPVAA